MVALLRPDCFVSLCQSPPLPNPSPTRGEGLEDTAAAALPQRARGLKTHRCCCSSAKGEGLENTTTPLSPCGRGAGGEGASAVASGGMGGGFPSPPTPLPQGARGASCSSARGEGLEDTTAAALPQGARGASCFPTEGTKGSKLLSRKGRGELPRALAGGGLGGACGGDFAERAALVLQLNNQKDLITIPKM
jgi:hypothetical protein